MHKEEKKDKSRKWGVRSRLIKSMSSLNIVLCSSQTGANLRNNIQLLHKTPIKDQSLIVSLMVDIT